MKLLRARRYACSILLVPTVSMQLEATRPNIVFIFADDWGWGDLSCHGHPYVKTPNIDRLAREGTDFHRFTVASGVCSPSRTAVMTGHFPARYNIDGHFRVGAQQRQTEHAGLADTHGPPAAEVSATKRIRDSSLWQMALCRTT